MPCIEGWIPLLLPLENTRASCLVDKTMKDKIREITSAWLDSSKQRKHKGTMVDELAELVNAIIVNKDKEIAELKKRLLLYEKKEGDAFVDKIP
jgi:hypothetical protein